MFNYKKYAKNYNNEKDFDRYLLDFKFKMLQEWSQNLGDCLELGCAMGIMTEKLLPLCRSLDVVDASADYLKIVQQKITDRFPDRRSEVSFHNCFFQNYRPEKLYDSIVLAGVLPALDEPDNFLRLAGGWLKETGFIFITSHNAFSLHRRIGKIMGLVGDEHELSERDRLLFNHKKVYDLAGLEDDIKKSGLVIKKIGGVFLKPFPNDEMLKLSQECINAFFEVSRQLDPALAAELYAIAAKSK